MELIKKIYLQATANKFDVEVTKGKNNSYVYRNVNFSISFFVKRGNAASFTNNTCYNTSGARYSVPLS